MAVTSQAEKVLGKTRETHLIRRLLRYLRPYRRYAVVSVLLTIVEAPLMLASPPLTKAAVDLFIAPDTTKPISGYTLVLKQSADWLGFGGSARRGVLFIAFVFLLANLLNLAVQYTQNIIMQSMGQYIMYDLRRDIFEHLQRLPARFHDRNPVGRLMTRLTSDVDALNEMFTNGLVAIFSNLIVILYIVAWMCYVNWRLTLVSLTILPLLTALTIWFRRGTRAANAEMRVHIARINAFLQEHLGGMSVVQLFGREKAEADTFESINRDNLSASVRALFFNSVFLPAVEIIGAIGMGLILWYGGRQVIEGVATLGTLIAFIQLARSFYQPISDTSQKYNVLQTAMAASERIFELLDEPLAIESPANPVRPASVKGEVEFRHVWFAYEDEDWILKDVSFVVAPGEHVAFVGHTGAGKTTISNLLYRFYDVQRGQILLDGIDIRQWDVEELRANFSIVLQDVSLRSGDIAGNIRLSNNAISDERLREVAQEVHVDQFIRRLPEGYATKLHERGAGLSVGQKQLISFARALVFNPRVLILDEATSSVDTETESLVQDAIQGLMKGRTALVIAHRLSTIQSVDKIIVMHKGEVREVGTHQELLSQKGLYWRLYKLQFGHDLEVSRPQAIGELV